MRPSLSLRSISVVALLLAGGIAGASSCAGATSLPPPTPAALVPLDEAVRRTVDAGSARLTATITDDDGAVSVTGVMSWREPRSTLVVEADGSPPAEVRVTARGTWLRLGSHATWTRVPPATRTRGATDDWRDLLDALEPAGRPRGPHLRATHAGQPARVDLDGDGRIRRLRLDKASGRLDLRLADHGIEVEVDDP